MSTERLPYATAAYWVRVIGLLTGFKFDTISYNLRYNAAMEFDKSEDVSEGLRNLMMQHADSRVLLKHYLSHQVSADGLAITRGLKPQRALVKSMGSLGSSISKRRPTQLTTEQSASVNYNPRIKKLVRRRDALRTASKRSAVARRKYDRAVKKVEAEKTRLRKALKSKIREEFDSEQAVIDIERQLAGMGFDTSEPEMPIRDQAPAQKRLMEAMCAPMNCKTLDELYRRRDAAIDEVAAYCAVEEDWSPVRRRFSDGMWRSGNAASGAATGQDPPEGSAILEALKSVFKDGPLRCFLCVGNAWQLWKAGILREDDPRIMQLIYELKAPWRGMSNGATCLTCKRARMLSVPLVTCHWTTKCIFRVMAVGYMTPHLRELHRRIRMS